MAKKKKNDPAVCMGAEKVERPARKSPAKKSSSEFWEKYKHPKWQEMRLRVMERAGFVCEECGDNGSTLNVHHSYYVKGKDPWDYPASSLLCLCEGCHTARHELMDGIKRLLGKLPCQALLSITGDIKAETVLWEGVVELTGFEEALAFCNWHHIDFWKYEWPFHSPSKGQLRLGSWATCGSNTVFVNSKQCDEARACQNKELDT